MEIRIPAAREYIRHACRTRCVNAKCAISIRDFISRHAKNQISFRPISHRSGNPVFFLFFFFSPLLFFVSESIFFFFKTLDAQIKFCFHTKKQIRTSLRRCDFFLFFILSLLQILFSLHFIYNRIYSF